MSSDRAGELEAGFRFVTSTLAAARSADVDRPEPEVGERVPVTLLTGLLGSGKTTVLERLLAADHGLRVSVIVNDLGSVNVDGTRLAASSAGVERLELTNGCACCALSDDLADTLRRAVTDLLPDAIVVEASGAADPIPMAAVVEAESGLRLDGIVAVADADALPAQLAHPALGRLARRQVAAAHIVLLSKVDLASEESVDQVREMIAEIAPGRMIIPIRNGVVEPVVLLSAATRGAALRPPGEEHELTVTSRTVPLPAPLDIVLLARWLERGEHGLLRAKGTIVGDDGARYELQVVGRRWTLTPEPEPAPDGAGEATGGVVVVIADNAAAVDEAAGALSRAGGGARPSFAGGMGRSPSVPRAARRR